MNGDRLYCLYIFESHISDENGDIIKAKEKTLTWEGEGFNKERSETEMGEKRK